METETKRRCALCPGLHYDSIFDTYICSVTGERIFNVIAFRDCSINVESKEEENVRNN